MERNPSPEATVQYPPTFSQLNSTQRSEDMKQRVDENATTVKNGTHNDELMIIELDKMVDSPTPNSFQTT